MNFLTIDSTYQDESDGSLFKYNGVVSRLDGQKEHEFQCIEFDCHDELQHYSIDTKEEDFQKWFRLSYKA